MNMGQISQHFRIFGTAVRTTFSKRQRSLPDTNHVTDTHPWESGGSGDSPLLIEQVRPPAHPPPPLSNEHQSSR